MKALAWSAALRGDSRGSVLVEFALLAPMFLLMLIGIFQVGLHYQNYNAVRSLSAEAARYVMVEYQKSNDLTEGEITSAVLSMAEGNSFLLDPQRINVVVTSPTSRIAGAKEFSLDIVYDPPNFLGFAEIEVMKINYSRPIFVIPVASS